MKKSTNPKIDEVRETMEGVRSRMRHCQRVGNMTSWKILLRQYVLLLTEYAELKK